MKKNNITQNKIWSFFLFLFLIFSYLSERTFFGRVTLFLFLLISIIIILKKRKLYLDKYFLIELLFILYSILQILFDFIEYKEEAYSMIVTLSLSLFVYMMFYNYLVLNKSIFNGTKIFYMAIYSAIIINSLITLSDITNRTQEGIFIFGLEIGGVIATSVGWMAGIILMLSIFFSKRDGYNSFLFSYIVLSTIIVLSGTRKALLFIPVSLITYLIYQRKRFRIEIFFLQLSFIFLLGVLTIILIYKIPIAYNSIGYRLDAIINYIKDSSTLVEASLSTRITLIQLAKTAFAMKPLFGWGLDNFRLVFHNGIYYTHSNIYEILVSGGIVGFIIYYLKYIYVLSGLMKMKAINASYKTLSIILTILIITMIVLEYWQVTYFNRKSMMVFIIAIGLIRINNEERGLPNENTICSTQITH